MNPGLDPSKINPAWSVQGITDEDRSYQGSRYSEVKQAVFAHPYQQVWGAPDEPPFPHYDVTLKMLYEGILPGGRPDQLKEAANRTVDSFADLRWGPEGKGFRRIVHPNGVCLTGIWHITEETEFSGYFKKGSRGLVIARASVGSSNTARGKFRSFAIVGKIYPTLDETHQDLLKPANFFVQDDFGGSKALRITDVEMRNAPNTNAFREKSLPVLVRLGLTFNKVDVNGSIRQLHTISELGKEPGEATNTPEFMRLVASEGHLEIDEEDFRDEIMGHIFERGNPTPLRSLSFDISVANSGRKVGNPIFGGERHVIDDWHKIGSLTFENAVASYNGDFVIHFHHPHWRDDRNDPATTARR